MISSKAKVGDRVYYQWHVSASPIDGMGTVIEVRDDTSLYKYKLLMDDKEEPMLAFASEITVAAKA